MSKILFYWEFFSGKTDLKHRTVTLFIIFIPFYILLKHVFYKSASDLYSVCNIVFR